MKLPDREKKIREYMRQRILRKRWHRITALLAVLAAIVTTAALILPAITMEKTPEMLQCHLDLHTHTDSCYDEGGNIICGYADFVVHTHDDSCYHEDGTLICPLKEIAAHTHTAFCYQETRIQTCEEDETSSHVHTDSCYEIQKELVCGKEEIILHTHTPECFDENGKVICGKLEVKEHVHDQTCRPPVKKLLAQSAANSIDFEDMITKITLQVQQNGYWVDLIGGTVEEGSPIRLRIEFTVAGGTLSDGNRAIHYQLPDGIRLNEPEQGLVDYNDGDPAGTYTISTDGYIQILFDQDFPVEQDFSGYLQFEGTVALIGDEGGGTIDFGGSGGSITIVPEEKELDLSISKTGVYNKDTNKIAYTIEVSSVNGTNGERVHIGDWFQHDASYGFISYDTDSLQVVKHTKTGSENVPVNTLQINLHQQDGTGPGWWTIQNLPPLEAGEAYELTYTAAPDLEHSGDANGHLEFTNVAAAQSGGKTVNAYAKVVISQAVIDKTIDSYNPYDRSVTWTLYVRNPDGKDLAGERLEDIMSFWPDGAQEPAWSNPPAGVTVTVGIYDAADVNFNTRLETVVLEDVDFPFTFPENSTGSYTLTFTTKLPEELAGQTGYFNNWARFQEYEVNVGAGEEIPDVIGYDVVKTYWGKEEDLSASDGKTFTALNWGSVVTYPQGAQKENVAFVDLIADAVTEDGTVIPGSHYTTAEVLYAGGVKVAPLIGNAWGKLLTYPEDYEIYVLRSEDTPDGISDSFAEADFDSFSSLQWINIYDGLSTGSLGPNEPLSMIRIVLTDSGWEKLAGNPMVLQYYTVLDADKLPAGSTLTVPNLARIPNAWDEAVYEEHFRERLDKQVSFTGPNENTGDVSSYGDTPAGTIGPDGLIYYRLLLTDFMRDGTGGATVTDTLPAGAKLVDGSVYLVGHYQNTDVVDAGNVTQDVYYIQYTTQPSESGTTLTFILSHLNYLEHFDVLGIYYTVSVADDPAWETQTRRDYTNTASWDGETDSTTTTVTQTLPVLKKIGNQLYLEDGTPSNVVRYYVTVNPNGEQLLEEAGGILTLTDTLTVPEGAAARLLLETAQVCYYDPAQEHGIGEPLAEGRYTIQYDGETHELTVKLPDATPCVVVYDYQIDRGQSSMVDLTVNNKATLQGYATTGSDFSIVVEEQSSSAGVNTANLIIYKVNSENNAELINGALFSLERYEEQTNGAYQWGQTSITAKGPDGLFITGGDGPDGQIILNFLNEEGISRYNTIYRLQEKQAADGFQIIDNSYHYFVWMERDATEQQTIMAMQEAFEKAGITPEQVYFIPFNANHSLYIENEPLTTSIRVEKEWRDTTGEPLTDGLPESITLTLYQHLNGGKKQYGEPVTIQADGNGGWSYTWEKLPRKDDTGNYYTYSVEETAVDGYKTSYLYPEGDGNAETGIDKGEVIITNTKVVSFILPETGGAGSTPFIIAGLLLVGMSGVGYLYFRQKRRKGGHAH